LDQRLIGTWLTIIGNDETQVTYSKDHRYSMREGHRGFPTGFYNETGAWDIYIGDQIE
jgi:hypothetical protein